MDAEADSRLPVGRESPRQDCSRRKQNILRRQGKGAKRDDEQQHHIDGFPVIHY